MRSLSGKGILAIFDQGFISGSNFILSIILARILMTKDYGAYALGFEVFLLLSVAYTALILEPMSVFGASVFREHGRQYFGALLRVHAVASVAILTVVGASAWIAHVFMPSSSLAGALAGVSVAGPVVLLYWVSRRAFYVKLSPRGAVTGGGVYFTVLMGGLFILYEEKWLSPFSAFLLIAAGAAVASLSMLHALKPRLSAGDAYPSSKEVLRRHWSYGRWALASAVPGWFFSGAMYYPLLSYFGGLAEAGKLKALLNLTSPISQAFVAVSMLSLPYASRIFHLDGVGRIKRLAWRFTLLYAGGTALYWTLLLAFHTPVLHALYGGKYTMIAGLLPLLALGSIFRITATSQSNILRAMVSPSSVYRVYMTVGVLAVLIGVPLIDFYGIKGAVLTFAISGVVAASVAMVTVLRKASASSAAVSAAEENAVPAEQASAASQG